MSPESITALAGIPIGTLAVYFMYRLVSNHLEHLTAAIEKLTDATTEHASADREFRGWLKGWLDNKDKEER